MKKKLSAGWIVLIVIAALLVIAIIAAVGTYNGLAQKREAVSAAEADNPQFNQYGKSLYGT